MKTKGEFLQNRMPSDHLENGQEPSVKMEKVGFAHWTPSGSSSSAKWLSGECSQGQAPRGREGARAAQRKLFSNEITTQTSGSGARTGTVKLVARDWALRVPYARIVRHGSSVEGSKAWGQQAFCSRGGPENGGAGDKAPSATACTASKWGNSSFLLEGQNLGSTSQQPPGLIRAGS